MFFLPLVGCAVSSTESFITKDAYGTIPDGREVGRYTLRNRQGWTIRIIEYGGIITELTVPDAHGNLADVVLGYDALGGYLGESPYLGSLIGRYGNRIAGGQFDLEGTSYKLAKNDGPHHLHGGLTGFDKVLWEAQPVTTPDGPALRLRYTSPEGDEGYPGALSVEVRYLWSHDGRLQIDYEATTDRTTVVNLTQHTYFNLTGVQGTSILGHELSLDATRMTPIDAGLIPTGELANISGTVFDFSSPTAIGDRIDTANEQLVRAGGYDHNFVVNGDAGTLRRAARVHEPSSGRILEVHTTEPGIQLYAGNFLDGTQVGKNGGVYDRRTGFCLETQHFPDSPNQPTFPSTMLRPGQHYASRTDYAFSTAKG